jgi:hypothetical protein
LEIITYQSLLKGEDQKKIPVSLYPEPTDAKKMKLEQKSAPCMDFNAMMDCTPSNKPTIMDKVHRNRRIIRTRSPVESPYSIVKKNQTVITFT